jgi:hypothetical protein
MTVEHVLHASIPPVGWRHVAASRLASTLSRLCEIGQSVSGSQRSLPPSRNIGRGHDLLCHADPAKLRLGSHLGHQCLDCLPAITIELVASIGLVVDPFKVIANDVIVIGWALDL